MSPVSQATRVQRVSNPTSRGMTATLRDMERSIDGDWRSWRGSFVRL